MFSDDFDDYTSYDLNPIFEKITEYFDEPVKLGRHCQANYFYRVEDLSEDDIDICAKYVANRIYNVISPQDAKLFLKLPGGHSFFAEKVFAFYTEMYPQKDKIIFDQFLESKFQNGHFDKFKGYNTILISDVVTTAKSTLNTHTKLTLKNIPILCWASLIDRTFGPGPVPLISAYTGAPVKLLDI